MQEFELNTTIIRPEPDEYDLDDLRLDHHQSMELFRKNIMEYLDDLTEEQDDKPQQKERVCPYCGNSGCYICLSHDEF